MDKVTHEAHRRRARGVLVLDNELGLGGLEKNLYDFVARVDRDRYRIVTCCLKDGGYFKEPFEALGIPFYERLLRHRYDLLAYRRLVRLIEAERIELIDTFAHLNTLLFSTLARRSGRVRALVVSFHAMPGESGRKLLGPHHRFLLRSADAIIAVAETHKHYLVGTEGLDARRIRVIHNGVDVHIYRPGPPDESIARELGVKNGEVVVTTVATLRPVKSLDILLRAAARVTARFSNVRFLLVGDGPERDRLETLARSLGIAGRVVFAGRREDVGEIMRLSHIFVLSSRSEAFPVAVLEAMASGMPVVTTDVGSLRELVTDGENGSVVPPMDAEALAEALSALVENPERARAWGKRGREIVEGRFRLEKMCEERERVFADLLGEAR